MPQESKLETAFSGNAHRPLHGERAGQGADAVLTERVFSEPSGAPWLDVPAFDYYDPFLGDCLESNSLFHCHIRQDPWE